MRYFKARYICLETHDGYLEGHMYTVYEWGFPDDWVGNYSEYFTIDEKLIDINKFQRVHHNIEQDRYTS